MNYRRVLTSTAGVLSALVVLNTATTQEAGVEVEEIRAVERERLQALVDADLDIATRLHADDFQLINPAGMPFSKEEYLGLVASGELDYVTWEPEHINVRRHNDVAIIRYRSRATVRIGGGDAVQLSGWHTDVYERRSGEWQVVWSQATAIQ